MWEENKYLVYEFILNKTRLNHFGKIYSPSLRMILYRERNDMFKNFMNKIENTFGKTIKELNKILVYLLSFIEIMKLCGSICCEEIMRF